MEITFSPLCIINPEITFAEYNENPKKVTIKVLVYHKNKQGKFVIKDCIEGFNISNYLFISGKFQFLHPYVFYTASVPKYEQNGINIPKVELKMISDYRTFEIDGYLYHKPLKENSFHGDTENSFMTKRVKVYDYIFDEEWGWKKKSSLKKEGKLDKKYLDIFAIHKYSVREYLIKEIYENDTHYNTLYESTSFFKINNSIAIWAYFYKGKITKEKNKQSLIINLINYSNLQTIYSYVSTMNYRILLLPYFMFFNNLNVSTLATFIERAITHKYTLSMSDNICIFVLNALVLIGISNNPNSDHMTITELRNSTSKNFKDLNDILKSCGIEDIWKNKIFSHIKKTIENIDINKNLSTTLNSLAYDNQINMINDNEKNTYIFFKSVFDAQYTFCQNICAIQSNLIKYSDTLMDTFKTKKLFKESVEESIMNERQTEFLKRVGEYDFSFHLIKGKPGTGKTTALVHTIKTLLQINESNILITSFQGSTKENLFNKVISKLFPSDKYNSLISAMTIHKFISKVSLMNMDKPEQTRIIIDENEFCDLEDANSSIFKQYYDDLKIIIIDEFSNVGFDLFYNFLSLIKDRVVKIIFVGDEKQCVSIESIPLMKKMEEFIRDKKKENITELIVSNRFNNGDGYIEHNVNLIYSCSTDIEKQFKYGEGTSVELITFDDNKLGETLIKIASKHEKTDMEIFTFVNEDVDTINTSIQVRGYMQGPVSEESKTYEKCFRDLLYENYDRYSIVRLGNKILNKTNSSSKVLENCYIFKNGNIRTDDGIVSNMLELLHDVRNDSIEASKKAEINTKHTNITILSVSFLQLEMKYWIRIVPN